MSDLSAEKVVAELPITPEDLRTIAKYACWDKFEDRYTSDPKKHPAWRAADLIAHQAARLEEEVGARETAEHGGDLLADDNAKLKAALTAAEAEKERLREALEPFAREADARSNLVLGPDIDGWPIGGSALTLGDLRRARAALSEKEQGDV